MKLILPVQSGSLGKNVGVKMKTVNIFLKTRLFQYIKR